jgi:hypothetical protein
MQHLTVRILIFCLLAGAVKADPIYYRQVAQDAARPQQEPTAAPTATGDTPQSGQPAEVQDGAPPQFVRLPDGRIVPYGPGTVCRVESEDSAELVEDRGRRRWLIAVPLVAAGILCIVLCRGGSTRTAVSTDTNPPTPLPGPGPTTPIPEPGTLILLGLGLAVFAQHGLGRRRPARK